MEAPPRPARGIPIADVEPGGTPAFGDRRWPGVSEDQTRTGEMVIFRNDDPSATSDVGHERRIADVFERYGVPQVLGVSPNCAAYYWSNSRGTRNVPLSDNPRMVEFLRYDAARWGSEIALHGLTNRTNHLRRPNHRGHFEFHPSPSTSRQR